MSDLIRTEKDMNQAGANGAATLYPNRLKIMIGSASCGIAAGAREVEAAAREAVKELGLDATVSRTDCIGFCQREPLVDLLIPGGPRLSYGDMTAAKLRNLLASYSQKKDLKPAQTLCQFESEEHVESGEVHQYSAFPSSPKQSDASDKAGKSDPAKISKFTENFFYSRQQRVILRNCGAIDPMRIEEAIARGADRGALRALTQMTPAQVIEEITKSGIRGRGGAGF